MENKRRGIDILEAENGYVVTWSRIAFPDEEVLLCPTIQDVLREIERIAMLWQE